MNKHPLDDLSRCHGSAKEAVGHAIQWLTALLDKPGFSVKAGGKMHRLMLRDLPYVIHDMDLSATQILVNRQYKPVGSTVPASGPDVKYEEFTNLHVRLSPSQIEAVVSPPHARGLFGDANSPWRRKSYAREYLERLNKLYGLL